MTRAQEKGINEFPYIKVDETGGTYTEYGNGYWKKTEYNDNGQLVNWQNSHGSWFKNQYNEMGKRTRWEDDLGRWIVWEYDFLGYEIYREDNDGVRLDVRRFANTAEK